MKLKKCIFVLSLSFNALGVVLLLLIAMAFFWHYRPLHPTWQWRVKARTHTGDRISVKTYKELGREVFFLRVTSRRNVSLGMEAPRWFVMDFSKEGTDVIVSADPGIYTVIGQHLIADQRYGLEIMDKKLEEQWHLAYTGSRYVVFSNNVFSVSAKRGFFVRKRPEVRRSTWESSDERIDPTPPEWDGVMGLNLTLFDSKIEEEGWLVYISTSFREVRDMDAVSHPPGLVLSNTNDVTAVASRTIYIDAGQNVSFRPQRAKTGGTNGFENLRFKADSFLP